MPTFDVFWPLHLQKVRSTVNIHVYVIDVIVHLYLHYVFYGKAVP